MGEVVGPARDKDRADATLTYSKIVHAVHNRLENRVEVPISVPTRIRDLLEQQLRLVGFSSVEFSRDEQGADVVIVTGNPYARNNITYAVNRYVGLIDTLLKKKKFDVVGKVFTIRLSVAQAAQDPLRNVLTGDEWVDVSFNNEAAEEQNHLVILTRR